MLTPLERRVKREARYDALGLVPEQGADDRAQAVALRKLERERAEERLIDGESKVAEGAADESTASAEVTAAAEILSSEEFYSADQISAARQVLKGVMDGPSDGRTAKRMRMQAAKLVLDGAAKEKERRLKAAAKAGGENPMQTDFDAWVSESREAYRARQEGGSEAQIAAVEATAAQHKDRLVLRVRQEDATIETSVAAPVAG
ncbi:MAG: hypothetical protein V2A79_01975 [Planctomycetota bacterium]